MDLNFFSRNDKRIGTLVSEQVAHWGVVTSAITASCNLSSPLLTMIAGSLGTRLGNRPINHQGVYYRAERWSGG